MSKLFFISFNLCTHPYEVYPLGMAVVAQSARQQGHTVSMYDYLVNGQNNEHLAAAVKEFAPDYLCISIRNLDDDIDSGYCADNNEKYLHIGNCIRYLKSFTPAAVIIGGPAVSLAPQSLLDLLGADYAVVGEGEKLCSLISDLQQSKPVPRILNYTDHLLNGSEIGSALHCPEMVRWYYEQSGFIGVQTKRGCSFSCLYCTYPILDGRSFRHRDKEDVIEEIRRLKTDYECRNFFFTDSVFNDPAGGYKELAEALIRSSLDIQWTAYFTPYRLSRQDIELCRQSGLYAIELGTDASSSVTLAGLNKKYDWQDVVSANEIITAARLPCAHYVIFGGPNETYQTLEEGIENCKHFKKSVVFGFTGIRIYPKSPLFERAVRDGLVKRDDPLLEPVYYFSPAVEKEKVNQMITQGWNGSRRLVFPPEKGKQISQYLKTNMNVKGLIWDQLCRM